MNKPETPNRVASSAGLAGDDVVIGALKKRYFEVASKEDYPNTPKLTAEADHLEKAIRELQAKPHDANASEQQD